MLKKEEVYVRVLSKKKARKVKELLEMFGEKIFQATLEIFDNGEDLYGCSFDEYPYVMIDDNDGEWSCFSHLNCNKTKVSLKELRNILARDYLKEGDVVVIKGSDTGIKRVGVVNDVIWNERNEISIVSDNFSDLDNIDIKHNGLGFAGNFIRYATEEEKQLLKPEESVIDKAISLLQHGLGLDYSHEVVQGLEEQIS